MEGESTVMAIADLLSNASNIVSSGLEWVTQVVNTITSNPLILMFALLGLVGLGIGLVKRLLFVN